MTAPVNEDVWRPLDHYLATAASVLTTLMTEGLLQCTNSSLVDHIPHRRALLSVSVLIEG